MGILLIYDVSNLKSWSNVRNWVRNIHENTPQTVNKILIGNKYERPPRPAASPARPPARTPAGPAAWPAAWPAAEAAALPNAEGRRSACRDRCDLSSQRQVTTAQGEQLAREYGMQFLETSARANVRRPPAPNASTALVPTGRRRGAALRARAPPARTACPPYFARVGAGPRSMWRRRFNKSRQTSSRGCSPTVASLLRTRRCALLALASASEARAAPSARVARVAPLHAEPSARTQPRISAPRPPASVACRMRSAVAPCERCSPPHISRLTPPLLPAPAQGINITNDKQAAKAGCNC